MRSCGDCTACCDGWLSSKVVNMSPGKPCHNITKQGCAIYPNRPENPCKRFKCVWLQEEGDLNDSLRPDKCGAILRYRPWKSWPQVVVAIPIGRKVPEDTLEKIIEYSLSKHLPIVWSERAEDYVSDDAMDRKALGSEEFMTQVMWQFSDEDVQSLT